MALAESASSASAEIDAGKLPDFLPETAHIRSWHWRVPPPPPDLLDRRTEITGPVERKMAINALNSGAQCWMADFEDANSPTWDNVMQGQVNMRDAARRTISYTSPEGKAYALKPGRTATIIARPRGWHMEEKHILLDGKRVSASLFDWGLYFFSNAKALIAHGSGPYFYLPKMESHLEARLWKRRVHPRAGEARHSARDGAGDGVDRDDSRRLRVRGNPLRAARARVRLQLRPLGLTCSAW